MRIMNGSKKNPERILTILEDQLPGEIKENPLKQQTNLTNLGNKIQQDFDDIPREKFKSNVPSAPNPSKIPKEANNSIPPHQRKPLESREETQSINSSKYQWHNQKSSTPRYRQGKTGGGQWPEGSNPRRARPLSTATVTINLPPLFKEWQKEHRERTNSPSSKVKIDGKKRNISSMWKCAGEYSEIHSLP